MSKDIDSITFICRQSIRLYKGHEYVITIDNEGEAIIEESPFNKEEFDDAEERLFI